MRLIPSVVRHAASSTCRWALLGGAAVSALAVGCGSLSSDLLIAASTGGTPTDANRPTQNPNAYVSSALETPGIGAGKNWSDEQLERQDIRRDSSDQRGPQDGLLLRLNLSLRDLARDANGQAPLGGAQVDLWQANASGDFSRAQGAYSKDWLRGFQTSSSDGNVSFTTIVPAGSEGRTPHLHVRIRLSDASAKTIYNFTTELYFDPALIASTLTDDAYSDRPLPDVSNANDVIYTGGSLEGHVTRNVGDSLLLTTVSQDANSLSVSKTLYLDRNDSFYAIVPTMVTPSTDQGGGVTPTTPTNPNTTTNNPNTAPTTPTPTPTPTPANPNNPNSVTNPNATTGP